MATLSIVNHNATASRDWFPQIYNLRDHNRTRPQSRSSGTGLLGFATAYLGAEATLTDTCVELMHVNAAKHTWLTAAENSGPSAEGTVGTGTRGTYQIHQYYWGDDPVAAGMRPPYDLIFCSDLVFITCRDRCGLTRATCTTHLVEWEYSRSVQ